MYVAHRWRDRNLTRLELVVSLLLIGLFIYFLLQRAIYVYAAAEKNYLDYTVANINTALQLQALMYFSTNRMDELGELVGANPMTFMERQETEELRVFYTANPGSEQAIKQLYAVKASNYVGELLEPDLDDIKGGKWYFDIGLQKLVYVVMNAELFTSELTGKERIVFSVVLDYKDENANGIFESTVDEFIRLYIRNDYIHEWQI